MEAGATQINNYYGSREAEKESVSIDRLVKSVEQVRSYFWGESAIAVIFCVCRDYYEYANNMSQFERDFGCKEGLLSNTFRNNSYMQLPVNRWQQNGAKERVLILVDAYRKVVSGYPRKVETYRTYRKTYRGAWRCFMHLFFVPTFALSDDDSAVLFDLMLHNTPANAGLSGSDCSEYSDFRITAKPKTRKPHNIFKHTPYFIHPELK